MSSYTPNPFYDLSQGLLQNEESYITLEDCLLERNRQLTNGAELEDLIQAKVTPTAWNSPMEMMNTSSKEVKKSFFAPDFNLDSNNDETPNSFVLIDEESRSELPFSLQALDSEHQTQAEIDAEGNTEFDEDTFVGDQRYPRINNNRSFCADDRKKIRLIKQLSQGRSRNARPPTMEELRQNLLGMVASGPRRQPFQKIWNSKLKSKRCNQTRYVTSLLRLMSQALLELPNSNNPKLQYLPAKLDSCSKIRSIQEVLRDPETPELIQFIDKFLSPEGDSESVMLELLHQIDYNPFTKMLILEAIPVVRIMINSSKPISSWKVEKVEVRGEYTAAVDILNRGGSLAEVKEAVEKEYLKIQPKLRTKAGSTKNNTIHYQVQATKSMLQVISNHLVASLEQCQESVEKENIWAYLQELKNSIEQLESSEAKASIQIATRPSWLKKCILEEFVMTNKLLRYFLSMESVNALCIHNLVMKYEEFVQTFFK